MGETMPKKQQEYIENIQKDCLERTNMTEEEAWNFAFRCWQLGYIKLTREKVKEIFEFGAHFAMANCYKEKYHSGTFPTNDLESAIDYVYKFVIEGERDEECLYCGRYLSGSCQGTINRGRETITDGNRCGGFYRRKYEFRETE